MSGFDYIIIFVGSCLVAFGIVELFVRKPKMFSNFDGLPLIHPILVARLPQEEEFFTRKGHTLVGFM